jgi:predicted methyltransferase
VSILGEIPENERMNALRELYDALKPGGIVSITEIFPDPIISAGRSRFTGLGPRDS